MEPRRAKFYRPGFRNVGLSPPES